MGLAEALWLRFPSQSKSQIWIELLCSQSVYFAWLTYFPRTIGEKELENNYRVEHVRTLEWQIFPSNQSEAAITGSVTNQRTGLAKTIIRVMVWYVTTPPLHKISAIYRVNNYHYYTWRGNKGENYMVTKSPEKTTSQSHHHQSQISHRPKSELLAPSDDTRHSMLVVRDESWPHPSMIPLLTLKTRQ